MEKLTPSQRLEPLWRLLVERLQDRLMELRAKNDTNLTESETAMLRGRIAELKAVLDMGTDDPQSQ